MGNSIAKDFKNVKLGCGSLSPGLEKALIAPGSVVLDSPTTVIVRHDHSRGSLIVFDLNTMMPLLVTKKKRKKQSVTKDAQGRALYLSVSPNSNQRLIYKVPKSFASNSDSEQDFEESCPGLMDASLSSFTSASTASSASSLSKNKNDLVCSGQIDIDKTGASTCASLSVVVWKGNGPELLQIYRAVQVPSVKYGSLIVDHQGNVVGKSMMDPDRLEPILHIAKGADISSVVALATSTMGDF